MNVHFIPRVLAERSRKLGAEPRKIAPTRKLTPLLEREDAPPPAKLSADEAARCFNVVQGGRLWR